MPLMRLKMVVFAPMPMASVATATAVNPGAFSRDRTAKRMSPSMRADSCQVGCRLHCFHLLFDHAAVEKMNAAVGEAGVARIVRHHHDGRAVAMQFAHQVHDGF